MAGSLSTKVKPVCSTRQVKIGRKFYDFRRKMKDNSQAKVPWLQLRGHWLGRTGFDSTVTVRVMEVCLVLTLA